MYLLHNAVWNFIFYAICIRHIYRTFTEIDLGYKNMYIKETPYYFSVLIFVFYLLKSMYVTIVLDSGETEYFSIFCMIYLPLSFMCFHCACALEASCGVRLSWRYFCWWHLPMRGCSRFSLGTVMRQ